MLSQLNVNRLKRKVKIEPLTGLVKIFCVLGDPRRLQIFRLLMTNRDICVSDLAKIFGVSVPAASQHLRIMEMVGLLKRVKMGKMICYEIRREEPMARSIANFLAKSQPYGFEK